MYVVQPPVYVLIVMYISYNGAINIMLLNLPIILSGNSF